MYQVDCSLNHHPSTFHWPILSVSWKKTLSFQFPWLKNFWVIFDSFPHSLMSKLPTPNPIGSISKIYLEANHFIMYISIILVQATVSSHHPCPYSQHSSYSDPFQWDLKDFMFFCSKPFSVFLPLRTQVKIHIVVCASLWPAPHHYPILSYQSLYCLLHSSHTDLSATYQVQLSLRAFVRTWVSGPPSLEFVIHQGSGLGIWLVICNSKRFQVHCCWYFRDHILRNMGSLLTNQISGWVGASPGLQCLLISVIWILPPSQTPSMTSTGSQNS